MKVKEINKEIESFLNNPLISTVDELGENWEILENEELNNE